MAEVRVVLTDDEVAYVEALAAVRGTTPDDVVSDALHALPVGWTERREVNEYRLRQRALSARRPRADAPAWLRSAGAG